MSDLVDYAKDELKRIGMIDSGEPYNDWATKAILDLLELFESQYHSGFTARYVINAFSRLAMFKPLSPLTGEEDEWMEVGTDVFQNKRYSAVFKDKDGTAYNIEGKVFTDDGEVWYMCKDSSVNVTFPYSVPTNPEYVYRNKEDKEDKKDKEQESMTREEAIAYGEMWLEILENSKGNNMYEFFKVATQALKQEPKADALDKIRGEIDRQRKWLFHAGYTAYNVDIALNAIKRVAAESE